MSWFSMSNYIPPMQKCWKEKSSHLKPFKKVGKTEGKMAGKRIYKKCRSLSGSGES